MPARISASAMANPPSSMAVKPPSAPDSFPMGVRAPATMTASAMTTTSESAPAKLPAGNFHSTAQVSSGHMSDILSAVLAGAPAEELATLPLPATYRAAVVRRADVEM